MEEIKAKLSDINKICIEDQDAKGAIMILLEVNQLLIAKLEQIPDWVFENKCCPPGDSCCNCN